MSDSVNSVLLDTDVFSYLLKTGDRRGGLYQPHVQGKTIAVTFVTVGELLYGAAKKNWGKKKLALLQQRLRSAVIVPYDAQICRTYGTLKHTLRSSGRVLADNDLWIAACALRHGLPLVSNNRKHFEGIPNLTLISEAPLIAVIESQQHLPLVPSGSSATESEPPSERSPSG